MMHCAHLDLEVAFPVITLELVVSSLTVQSQLESNSESGTQNRHRREKEN